MEINNKNYILCIDTTSNISSVAIIKGYKILFENNIDNGLNHSVTLFENISSSLKALNISMKDISVVKVSNGPGSFTGLRIGIAAALGLSKAYNTKIECIDTLDSIATHFFFLNKYKNKVKIYVDNFLNINKNNKLSINDYNSKTFIISMIDARLDRIFMSLYNGNSLTKLSKDMVISIDYLCEILNLYFINKEIMFYLVGSGATNYKKIFNDKLKIKYKIYDDFSKLTATNLAYTSGKVSKLPFTNYLLASKAEREKLKNYG